MTERANALTERANALTERANALTERANALTERANALSERPKTLGERPLMPVELRDPALALLRAIARRKGRPLGAPAQRIQCKPLDAIAKAVALLPFTGNTVGAGIVPLQPLSLEQYASLRAELSVWPERWAEILPRYQVMTAAACRALDEHWQMQLAASPEARATFEKSLAEYTAWLRTQRERSS